MRIWLAAIAALTLGFAAPGCGDDSKNTTTDPQVGAGKADCPDCDPSGPNAFKQANVADGFYAKGDTWQVAYRFNRVNLFEKREQLLFEDTILESEVYLFNYEVLSNDEDTFDNVKRELATIRVSQATPSGANADLFNAERLDTYEHKVEFMINDLLDPVEEVTFNRDYPNGKTIRLDAKSNLKTGASVFPRTIPRLLVNGGIDSPAPELPADLRDVVDAMMPSWSSMTYLKYVFDNGDTVYWAKEGDILWPFYVETTRGAGVLVSWR